MGGAASKLTRRVETRFNAGHRAQKFIEKQQKQAVPRAPPKFESSVELLKQIEKKHPDFKELKSIKDISLDERLKQVRIDSFGPPPEVKAIRNLPQNRSVVEDPEFGHLEPHTIPSGKLSVRQLMEGLEKSMLAPLQYTHREFAHEYDLEVEKAETIFHYFKPYNLYTDVDKDVREQYRQLTEEKRAFIAESTTGTPLKAGNKKLKGE